MARLTSDWTERHAAVAPALVVAAVAGLVVAAEPTRYWTASVLAVVLTVLVSLRLDALGGILAGLVAAAAVVAVKQATGGWTPEAFGASLAVTLTLVALGWTTGGTSRRLEARGREDRQGAALTAPVSPAYGSLGLLTGDVALARLDEEIARARRHRRPLGLVLLRVRLTEPDLSEEARRAARRSVARLVETLLRDTDVPFALGEDEVGAILPETTADAAWELVGPLVEAVTGATFTDRVRDERRDFADVAELDVGLAMLPRGDITGEELLVTARRAAEESAEPFAGTGGW